MGFSGATGFTSHLDGEGAWSFKRFSGDCWSPLCLGALCSLTGAWKMAGTLANTWLLLLPHKQAEEVEAGIMQADLSSTSASKTQPREGVGGLHRPMTSNAGLAAWPMSPFYGLDLPNKPLRGSSFWNWKGDLDLASQSPCLLCRISSQQQRRGRGFKQGNSERLGLGSPPPALGGCLYKVLLKTPTPILPWLTSRHVA